MMMRDLLLSSAVLVSTLSTTFSSTAIAAPGLAAEPSVDTSADLRVDAEAPRVSQSGTASTYLAASTSILASDLSSTTSVVGMLVRAEAELRLGDAGAYLHLAGATIRELPMYEVRGGFEVRGSGSNVRAFGGADLGIWVWDFGVVSGSMTEVVPRVGVDVGQRVWLRGTLEAPFALGRDADYSNIPLELNLGLGVTL